VENVVPQFFGES